LLVEIPIQDQWLGAAAATWHNRVVQIPIRGTLSHPQVDGQVLAQIAAQLAQGTGQRVIGDQTNLGLDRLLGPRPNN